MIYCHCVTHRTCICWFIFSTWSSSSVISRFEIVVMFLIEPQEHSVILLFSSSAWSAPISQAAWWQIEMLLQVPLGDWEQDRNTPEPHGNRKSWIVSIENGFGFSSRHLWMTLCCQFSTNGRFKWNGVPHQDAVIVYFIPATDCYFIYLFILIRWWFTQTHSWKWHSLYVQLSAGTRNKRHVPKKTSVLTSPAFYSNELIGV